MRDIRTVNMVAGQQAEAERVFKRIGDISYRNLGVLAKIGLFDSGSLLVTSGLTVTPVSGMTVQVALGAGMQRTGSGDVLPFLQTTAQNVVIEAADGSPRTDIIECQVVSSTDKNDNIVTGNIDHTTGLDEIDLMKRDIAYSLAVRAVKGTVTPTAATAGILTGTVAIATTIDLSVKYLLHIADGEDGSFQEIDLRGAVPMSTTKAEIVSAINTAVGRTIASISGNYIVLTGSGTGLSSMFEIKQVLSDTTADALYIVFGISSNGLYNYIYQGSNAWVKICELDVESATTEIYSNMIRDISLRSTWSSLSGEITIRSAAIPLSMSYSVWQTGKAYAVDDVVITEYGMFQCLIAHTAGVELDDLLSTKWVMINVGAVPTADDSSIGTDGIAFKKFQMMLNRSIMSGTLFSNTVEIVSTYSMVYTTGNAYFGGVLSVNGDIHLIPFSAAVGQKISAAGVVSTYSLVLATGAAYAGGVLSPNGDIHMIPHTAVRGQKISPNGIVSTYSIVYTAATAYFGGVLAPNGDTHMIPFSAARGQKISAAGVVSTYSLVYTTANAYQGGVLASNGDIHMIINAAPVGQKISASGVVSTYSLIVTSSGSYNGGVLAANGDIHMIPYSAVVGQKISAAGVVSTYSLAYTGGTYNGGILSPNGDIHMMPYSAPVGQKISAAGVVSTYSLAYTVANAGRGGVLMPNGDIHLSTRTGEVGQKISTGFLSSLSRCCSPFFNKY